jgi:3-hydroxyacyl-CoA dehydrogenase
LRLAIADRLRDAHGARFMAPELLRAQVAQGHLGRKTSQGFYPHPQEDP